MMFGVRAKFLYLFGVTIALVVLTLYVSTSSRFTFAVATVDGRQVDELEARSLGLRVGESIFEQNLELVAEALSRRQGIGAATVTRELPDKIIVHTNRFDTEYLIFDHETNSLMALNRSGLVTPLDSVPVDMRGPVFLGIKNLTLFEKAADFRLSRVSKALERLSERSEKWYAGISAIDFSSEHLLVLSFDNYSFQALVDPLTIDQALSTLEKMTTAQIKEVTSAKIVNLCYDGLITLSYDSQENSNGDNRRVAH